MRYSIVTDSQKALNTHPNPQIIVLQRYFNVIFYRNLFQIFFIVSFTSQIRNARKGAGQQRWKSYATGWRNIRYIYGHWNGYKMLVHTRFTPKHDHYVNKIFRKQDSFEV